MATPKNMSEKLIREFFIQWLPRSSDSLACDLEEGKDINGAEMVDAVATFYEACKQAGTILPKRGTRP